MTTKLFLLSMVTALFVSPANSKLKEDSKIKSERQPTSEVTLSDCKKLTDRELALDLINFTANGGLSEGSRCTSALNESVFKPLEFGEGDIMPRLIRINETDKIEIVKLEEWRDFLGNRMNTWELHYVIHTKNKKIKGQLEFSRSHSPDDLKNYGCGFIRYQPDQIFIRKSCEMR